MLSFVAQIETLCDSEGVNSFPDIFATHAVVEAVEGERAVNTLNFLSNNGQSIKLRPLYNRAMSVIRHTMLRDHPSNPGHATQSWPAYKPLITYIARLEPAERRYLAEEFWRIGVLDHPARVISRVDRRETRPFEILVESFPTHAPKIRGGALLQGLAYGYLRADSPNLILESHNVNTGSSRAGMLGDVDGFRGQEPELAAEVKDMNLTLENASSQLDDFFADMESAPNVTAVVICESITAEAREYVMERRAIALDRAEILRRVTVWDVPKQQEAIRGMEYYLGRIQKSQEAVAHLHNWLHMHGLRD